MNLLETKKAKHFPLQLNRLSSRKFVNNKTVHYAQLDIGLELVW